MTTIDFYTHCASRYEVAATLVAKAWSQHGSARVLTPDGVALLTRLAAKPRRTA